MVRIINTISLFSFVNFFNDIVKSVFRGLDLSKILNKPLIYKFYIMFFIDFQV